MRRAALAGLMLVTQAGAAWAHSAERGFVMLLPTTLIITAGALAVALSFAVAVLLPDRMARCLTRWSLPLFRLPLPAPWFTQALAAVALLLLIAIGILGPTDPLANLLPLMVWVGWWVVIVLLHPLFGNVWHGLNPLGLLARLPGLVVLPRLLGHWLAVLLFLAFSWFQLVHPETEDPRQLAAVILIYALMTLFMAVLVGGSTWLATGDPFAPVLRFLSLMAPFHRDGAGRISLQFPGRALVLNDALSLSACVLVVATLSTIAFDAVAASFTWLAAIGINPLDFPGRTAVMWPNTGGLLGSLLALFLVILLCTWAGWRLAGRPENLLGYLGKFALSLLPISVAFHFAHYLTALLINGQYLLAALAHPLGGGHADVSHSLLNTAHGAWAIFSIQAAAIVMGHMVSVVVAHLIVIESGITGSRALRLEAPMAALMVALTAFSLWALSTPSVG